MQRSLLCVDRVAASALRMLLRTLMNSMAYLSVDVGLVSKLIYPALLSLFRLLSKLKKDAPLRYAPSEYRTQYLLITSEMLYHLS